MLQSSVQYVNDAERSYVRDARECKACEMRKSTRVPRKAMEIEERGAAKPLERVCSDLVGPVMHCCIRGSRYFVILRDLYSGYYMVKFVTHRNEAGASVIMMARELENLLNGNLRRLTSINRNTLI